MCRPLICACLAMLFSVGVVAQNDNGASYHEIKTIKSDNAVTTEERYKIDAVRWSLTVEEWKRYLDIKKGPRGIWSPNLDPIAMLALEASSETEMRYYATMYAHMQDLRIKNELKVDRFRREAVQKLYSGKSTFDKSVFEKNDEKELQGLSNTSPLSDPGKSLVFGDRLLYFSDVGLSPIALIQTLTAKVQQTAGVKLDIYVTNTTNDKDIQEWAIGAGINAVLVKKKEVTINHDSGALKKLSNDNAKSQLFLQRGGVIYRVRESSI